MYQTCNKTELPPILINKKYGIVVSEFNKHFTEPMFNEAVSIFKQYNIEISKTIWVPGAFELPLASKILIENYQIEAVLALGVVIRGETSHYDHICNTVANSLSYLSLQSKIPVIFGLLTCENIKQVETRMSNIEQLVLTTIKMANIV